jgi:hypothetical protein
VNTTILVTYYLQSPDAIQTVVRDFGQHTGHSASRVIVVDNAKRLDRGSFRYDGSDFTVLHGSNRFWEFSGWIEGLETAERTNSSGVIGLLNDSYQKNWEFTDISRWQARRMLKAARAGQIAAWRDNFSWLKAPILSTRINSRFLFTPHQLTDQLRVSILAAIGELDRRVRSGRSLFSTDESARLAEWFAKNQSRWDSGSLEQRRHRVFIEHHLLDSVSPAQVSFFPRSTAESVAYAALRHLLGERR